MSNRDCVFCDKPHVKPWVSSMEFRRVHNLWDNSDIVFETIKKSRKKDWSWAKSWHCKYLDVRIDMRSGHCIIKDSQGNRISPDQLKYQYSEETPNEITNAEAYGVNDGSEFR